MSFCYPLGKAPLELEQTRAYMECMKWALAEVLAARALDKAPPCVRQATAWMFAYHLLHSSSMIANMLIHLLGQNAHHEYGAVPWFSMLHCRWHARVDEPLGGHGALHAVRGHELLNIRNLHPSMPTCLSCMNGEPACMQAHVRTLTVSRRESHRVLYWAISFWQAGSYSLGVTASLT